MFWNKRKKKKEQREKNKYQCVEFHPTFFQMLDEKSRKRFLAIKEQIKK